MRFVLEIDMGGSAFDLEHVGAARDGGEVARILRSIAGQVDGMPLYRCGARITRDVNGNLCGEYRIRRAAPRKAGA